MSTFAVSLRSKPPVPDGILMLLDDRCEAHEIATELCRKGQDVVVREVALKQEVVPAPDRR
jgi:hypothetical protein